MNRYSRHIALAEIGQEGQDKLFRASVLVIGAGGLGCPVLQYLTAAGVGTIGIIDFDIVEISNLQRQILFGSSSLGQNKALAATQRLTDLNEDISILAYPKKLMHANAIDLFNQYDIIVDGSDNFETRYLVNDACVITNKPLVFGAIYKFEGHVTVFNYNNGPSYRCVFPRTPKKGTVPNCAEVGVLGVLPGIVGNMQANEVLKIILGIGKILSGTLLCYNALTLQNSMLTIKRSEKEIRVAMRNKEKFYKKQTPFKDEDETIEVSIHDIVSTKNIQLIDVREAHEQPPSGELKITCIPLSKLENCLAKIDVTKKKIIFCQTGTRSKYAVGILQKLNIANCVRAKEGAKEIIETYKNSNTLQR